MKGPQKIQCKRAYDAVEKDDGYRVLVDRIWPRGVSKEALKLDDWKKELAPSSELRKWFGHDSKLWAAFYQKYQAELDSQKEALSDLCEAAAGTTLTLIFAAKDCDHNNAVALKMRIESS